MTTQAIRRVALIGSCGAGKSTLARMLGAITGLPLHHLDQLYWQAGWIEPPREQWRARQAELVAAERWIIDGNFGGTLDLRLARADLVILLDLPTMLCLWRVLRRVTSLRGRVRLDMAEGCPERLDWAFLLYVATFRWKVLPRTLARMAHYTGHVIVLRSRRQVADFVKQVRVDPIGWGIA